MPEQREANEATSGARSGDDVTRDNQENELSAEQESADSMDADVPHPPDSSDTSTEQSS